MDYLSSMEILSVEECSDKDYGASIIQYSFGEGHVAFSFCDIDVSRKGYDLEQIKEDVLERLNGKFEKPLWSDLSEILRNEIIESQFDMRFIEFDDEDWTEKKAEQVWEEADEHSIAVTCGEDGCYLTIYAGAMGDVNWSGHPEYGVPCLDEVIISPEKIKEIKDQEGIFEYIDSYGGTNFVQFKMDMYRDNDNLYLGLDVYDPEVDAMLPYGDVTVNTHVNLPYLHSLIDTNNNGAAIIPFLVEKGFGELTGQSVVSGYCDFPIFKFSEEKLMEVCPKEFSEYRKAYGKAPSLDLKIAKGAMQKTEKGDSEKGVEKEKER